MRLVPSIALTLVISASPAAAKTIGVAISNSTTFLTMLKSGIENGGAKIGGLTLKVDVAQNNTDHQLEVIRQFASNKVDAIIVAPVDGDLGVQISKIATDAGIPLVYVNNQPINVDELPEKQTFVASDEHDSGTMETKEICRQLKGKGRAVVMMGELSHFAARLRTQDVEGVLSGDECKGITVVERQAANWSREQASGVMREWLSAGVRFDAVIANNDDMALGAIDAMKAANIPMDKVVVGGIDATKDALAAMVAGDLDVTILQNADAQGAAAIDAAMKLTAGEILPKMIPVPFELVTSDNVKAHLPK
ncbi:sugar ABC transporter substrate-binding protein [Agrobacterium rhizogenes]|uniref:substrate-binding domain-containing protein n=1 Tax=Rhizobium rhizogenes TaxID=359 RepID=UPI001573E500|nr:substrate-binding domain-containing protein [Rhizobium rhizogenes]NTH16754.1 sugar ABC transporter substrate-binding protein [Rhizobium rhizogenes]